MQDNYFNVHVYIKETFKPEVLADYIEDHGQNGLDLLYTSEDAAEVNNLLESYQD